MEKQLSDKVKQLWIDVENESFYINFNVTGDEGYREGDPIEINHILSNKIPIKIEPHFSYSSEDEDYSLVWVDIIYNQEKYRLPGFDGNLKKVKEFFNNYRLNTKIIDLMLSYNTGFWLDNIEPFDLFA